ncbi:MAG: GDSL-type esterase/lipase family protein [Candidatus Rokuibacteriota bacterium]
MSAFDHRRSIRGRPTVLKLALAAAGVLVAVTMLEVGARVVSGNWTDSFLERTRGLLKGAYPVSYDPELGWVPRAGFSGSRNVWRTQVTITATGLRANGPDDPPRGKAPLLAVGDSFTFGDEVADTQTWPSHLQRTLGRPVLNAGVFGYGIDQMVLRARKLASTLQPDWVIVSFTPHDVARCELSEFGAPKPYFYFEHGELRPGHQPVPPPPPAAPDGFRRIFGHSFVVHTVLRRAAPRYWLQGGSRTTRVHGDGKKVAIHLLRALADDLSAGGIRLLVVAQAERGLSFKQRAAAAKVLQSLERSSAVVLDLHGPLAEIRERDAARFATFYRKHMTGPGNVFVAERIAEAIRQAEAAPPRSGPSRAAFPKGPSWGTFVVRGPP